MLQHCSILVYVLRKQALCSTVHNPTAEFATDTASEPCFRSEVRGQRSTPGLPGARPPDMSNHNLELVNHRKTGTSELPRREKTTNISPEAATG